MADRITGRVLDIFRQTSIYSAGGFLNKAVLVLMVPLFANYLLPADYSLLELFDPAEQFLAAIIILGQGQALLKLYQESKSEEESVRLLSTIFWFVLIVSALFVAGILLFQDSVLQLILRENAVHPAARMVFMLTLVSLAIRMVFQLASNYVRAEGKAAWHEAMIILGSLLYCTYNVFAIVWSERGIVAVFEARLLLLLPICILALASARKWLRFTLDSRMLRDSLKFGLPLVLAAASYPVLNFFDRWMLNDMIGSAPTGIYGMAYKFGMIPGMVLVAPFLKAWQPAIYRADDPESRNVLYQRMLLYYTLAGSLLWLGIAGFSRELMTWLTAPSYYPGYVIIPFIAASQFFYGLGWIVVAGLAVRSRTLFIGIWTMVAAAINIGLNAWLIPVHGILGAAYATVVAFFFIFAGFAVYAYLRLQIRFPYVRLFVIVAGSLVAFLLVYPIPIGGWFLVPKVLVIIVVMLLLTVPAGLSISKVTEVFGILSNQGKNDSS